MSDKYVSPVEFNEVLLYVAIVPAVTIDSKSNQVIHVRHQIKSTIARWFIRRVEKKVPSEMNSIVTQLVIYVNTLFSEFKQL